MKNQMVKKVIRIVLLSLVAIAVLGTFYFLWKKSQPVETVYHEIITPATGTVQDKRQWLPGDVEPRHEVLIKPQISGIIAELNKRPVRW